MSDQLLVVFRVCLLALMYLVFLRVVRAVWVELRAEAPRAAPRAATPAPSRRSPVPAAAAPAPVRPPPAATASGERRLQVVAPGALAGTSFALDGETTIGRAAGCGIPIDDSHVSKLHARVYPADGRWYVEDLGSTNGTRVNDSAIVAPAPIAPGDRVAVGDIVMELL